MEEIYQENSEYLFKSGIFSDLTININNEELGIKVHKSQMAIVCNAETLKYAKSVDIKGIDREEISAFVEFVYTGSLIPIRDCFGTVKKLTKILGSWGKFDKILSPFLYDVEEDDTPLSVGFSFEKKKKVEAEFETFELKIDPKLEAFQSELIELTSDGFDPFETDDNNNSLNKSLKEYDSDYLEGEENDPDYQEPKSLRKLKKKKKSKKPQKEYLDQEGEKNNSDCQEDKKAEKVNVNDINLIRMPKKKKKKSKRPEEDSVEKSLSKKSLTPKEEETRQKSRDKKNEIEILRNAGKIINCESVEPTKGRSKGVYFKGEYLKVTKVGFTCSICHKILKIRPTMESHFKTKHPEDFEANKHLVYSIPIRKSNKKLDNHPWAVKIVNRPNYIHENVFKCPFCDHKPLATLEFLKTHMKKFHEDKGMKEILEMDERPYKCASCGFTSKSPATLAMHEYQMHEQTPDQLISCEVCAKSFKTENNYKEHIQTIHHGIKSEKKFVCDICGDKFRNPAKVEEHKNNVHFKLRPFKCEPCDKSYGTLAILQKHNKLSHTEPYIKCEDCGKMFTCMTKKKMHYNVVHLKLKPHKCHFCDDHFSATNNRKKHMMKHHKEQMAENLQQG